MREITGLLVEEGLFSRVNFLIAGASLPISKDGDFYLDCFSGGSFE